MVIVNVFPSEYTNAHIHTHTHTYAHAHAHTHVHTHTHTQSSYARTDAYSKYIHIPSWQFS